MSQSAGREVRLRPEFTAIYPELPAGEWLPAAQWSEVLVSRAREARVASIHRRTFDPTHFEFRGGEQPRGARGRTMRTRREDGGSAG